MSKSVHSHEITIRKDVSNGQLPTLLDLAHRHFEKERPAGKVNGAWTHYTLPVDFLALTLPPDLREDIVEVMIVYRKR